MLLISIYHKLVGSRGQTILITIKLLKCVETLPFDISVALQKLNLRVTFTYQID
jgi:hypothetical protein